MLYHTNMKTSTKEPWHNDWRNVLLELSDVCFHVQCLTQAELSHICQVLLDVSLVQVQQIIQWMWHIIIGLHLLGRNCILLASLMFTMFVAGLRLKGAVGS